MTTTVEEYLPVRKRLAELGCALPNGLAFLPDNFSHSETAQDLLIRGEATTLTKVLAGGGIPVAQLNGNDARTRFIHNKSHDWAMPALMFTAESLRDNPDLASVVIDLIKDYVKDLFKGLANEKAIKADIVVEKNSDGTFQKISYEGNADGLDTLAQMIRDIHAQS